MSEAKGRVGVEDDNSQGIILFMREAALIDEASIRSFITHFNPDRRRNFKLFEYVVAHKFGAILWEKIPRLTKTSRGLLVQDSGVDCVTPDFAHAIQAKWHRSTSQVSFTELSTFFATGALMKATRLTIVTSEGVSLKVQLPNLEHVVISNAEYVQILVSFLPPVAVVETDGSGELVRINRELFRAIVELVDKNNELVVKNADLINTNTALTHKVSDPQKERPSDLPKAAELSNVIVQAGTAAQTATVATMSEVQCEKCLKKFRDDRDLKRHQARVTPCTLIVEEKDDEGNGCKYCGRHFTTKSSMQRHVKQSCRVANSPEGMEALFRHTVQKNKEQGGEIAELKKMMGQLIAVTQLRQISPEPQRVTINNTTILRTPSSSSGDVVRSASTFRRPYHAPPSPRTPN